MLSFEISLLPLGILRLNSFRNKQRKRQLEVEVVSSPYDYRLIA
jgi:hypothetical protein